MRKKEERGSFWVPPFSRSGRRGRKEYHPPSRYIPGSFSAPPRSRASVSPPQIKKILFFEKKCDNIKECVRLGAWCSSDFLWSQRESAEGLIFGWRTPVTYFCGNTLKSESNIYSPNIVVGIVLSGLFDKFSEENHFNSVSLSIINKSELDFSNPVSIVCLFVFPFLFLSFFLLTSASQSQLWNRRRKRRILLLPLFSSFISSVIDTFVLPFLLPPFIRHPKKIPKVFFKKI